MQEKKEFKFYLYKKPTLVIIDWYNIYNRYKNIDLQIFFDYLKEYSEIYQVRFYQGVIKDKDWSTDIITQAKEIGYEVITKESKYTKIDINKEVHLKNVMDMLENLLNSISDKNSEIANKIYTFKTELERKNRGNGVTDIYSEFFKWVGEMDIDLEKLNINIREFKNEINKPIKKLKCDFDAEIARDIILDIDKYENLILFSGDGDFASTVKCLVESKLKRIFTMYPQGSFGEIDYVNFGLMSVSFDQDNKKRYKYVNNFTSRPIDHILKKITKKEPADCSTGPDVDNISNHDIEVK